MNQEECSLSYGYVNNFVSIFLDIRYNDTLYACAKSRNFIVFEKEKETIKKRAAYHQYWAVNKAVKSTMNARKGNKKADIVRHTQGSGKSLTMVFYSG
jgi:hypothetical protein